MIYEKNIWEFYGFQSEEEGPVVQAWYDELDIDAQLEIINLAAYLRVRPGGLWLRPDFDPLDGEGGISELRPKNVRTEEGDACYRIYGIRECPDKHSYTFLHGTDKDVNNDVEGKGIAKRRLYELLRREGSVHRFNF